VGAAGRVAAQSGRGQAMNVQRAEINTCVCHALLELADEALRAAGFFRRNRSLAYLRSTEDAAQEIDVFIDFHPVEQPNAAAVIYPQYTVVIDAINKTVEAMTGGDAQLGGNLGITLHGPIEWTAPKGIGARWYIYQPDSVPAAVSLMREFVIKWTVPFLDRFRRPIDLCGASLDGDSRDVYSQAEVLRIVAAKVLCGQRTEALELMERWFGKPGPRRQYQRVF
jgi:hypothetical protein